jgi:hypothetical protein
VTFSLGQTIGDHQDVIGVGSVGAVHKVRYLISDQIETMKIVPPDFAGSVELTERFAI